MMNQAMKDRVTHIELLEEITKARDILDDIKREADQIESENYEISRSSDWNVDQDLDECREIRMRLALIDEHITEMNRVLHKMDIDTLTLLRGSI